MAVVGLGLAGLGAVAPAPVAVRGPPSRAPAARDLLLGGPDLDEAADDPRLRRPQLQLPRGVGDLLAARFSLPAGSTLELRGRYPHGRYMSLNAYSDGAPTDTLSDVAIEPDPGSTNPFVAGDRRDLRKRAWQVTVLDQPLPAERRARAEHALRAAAGAGAAIELVYRVYEPDRGLDLDGGTGLPRAELRLADGSVAARRGGLRRDQRPESRDHGPDDRRRRCGRRRAARPAATRDQPRLRPGRAGSASSTSTTPRWR